MVLRLYSIRSWIQENQWSTERVSSLWLSLVKEVEKDKVWGFISSSLEISWNPDGKVVLSGFSKVLEDKGRSDAKFVKRDVGWNLAKLVGTEWKLWYNIPSFLTFLVEQIKTNLL